LLPAQASPAGKRLYISRRDAGSRKFVNEDEIVSLLQAKGFQSVELSDYGFSQKIALFAHADIIVGLTGAGMTNMMFCHSGAQVIEMFPASYVTYFYASMAGYLGLDYRPLIFDNQSVLSSMNKYYGNLLLDVTLLDEMLSGLA
jgi:capsular polysaccharide biosynthesis protein